MDKKFREKITVALQKLEQYGGKVSWLDDYSVICIFDCNFAKTTSISGFPHCENCLCVITIHIS